MVSSINRFASRTLDTFINALVTRRAAAIRSAETLRRDAADVLSSRDVSDMLDDDGAAPDCDPATVLTLARESEARLREVDEALVRVAAGTYGYCTRCGISIPIARLRALPAAPSCVECSRQSSQRTGAPVNHFHPGSLSISDSSLTGYGALTPRSSP